MTDFDGLARAVDERVLELPLGCDPARCFGVRLRGDSFVLVPFWSGVAREMRVGTTPPDDCVAIALETSGWAAPLDECDELRPPSLHPQRRRVHATTLVYGDGDDITVMRTEDGPAELMRGGVGVVAELLRACWSARREAEAGH
jgi:hypothetical protein